MAPRGSVGYLLALFFIVICIPQTNTIPDLEVFKNAVLNFGIHLDLYLKSASGIDEISKGYEDNKDSMTFEAVDGTKLVSDMALDISADLERKTKALRKSVEFAEELVKEYHWNSSLQLGDVDYTNAKEVNTSQPGFYFSEKFDQEVNYNFSTTHVPVEIYEGDEGIQNSIAWTTGMDKIWLENAEADSSLLWQYFGSQTGLLRSFPAAKWSENGIDLYDVRRRPWYTQGASSPKDMLILVDTSGSTHGQALQLMKQSVASLLETLGENDFVNVARFSNDASFVSCFETFVQANSRHKKILMEFVEQLTAGEMASFTVGLDFAFKAFKDFNDQATWYEGAHCNQVIMMLTDGGTEMPEEVFKKYNWPKKKIRVFTYAVGPAANPLAAVRWIACANRGYFDKIPAMGAIRSVVQSYLKVLARPMTLANYQEFRWTSVLLDPWGLGMLTTVTMPVYNRTEDPANQTIVGVMATDVTTTEMAKHSPRWKLGPNGYSYAVNSNGYIVFHPNLKAQVGYLADPPNVDLLDVEFSTPEKEQMRNNMINNETGKMDIVTNILAPNEFEGIEATYVNVYQASRTYFYTGIQKSNFSLGMSVPQWWKYYVKEVPFMAPSTGRDFLESDVCQVLVPDWDFCTDIKVDNTSTFKEALIQQMLDNPDSCNDDMLQMLFFDAKVTETLNSFWTASNMDGIVAMFVATVGGITKVFPPSAASLFDSKTDPWRSTYFKRPLDQDLWVFLSDYKAGENGSITVSHSIPLTGPEEYKPGVVGALLEQENLRKMMLQWVNHCEEPDVICYLLDDGGYIQVTSEEDGPQSKWNGYFLGDVDPVLMYWLNNQSVYGRAQEYDFQGVCKNVKDNATSAGPTSIYIPRMSGLFEMLTLNWWTTKFAWLYINFNIYSWLSPEPSHYAFADVTEPENRSCIKLLTQYYINDTSVKEYADCGNCSRLFATMNIPNTNLIVIIAELDCNGVCFVPQMPSLPEETSDPIVSEDGTTCNLINRYRTKPDKCFDYSALEDDSDCGGSSHLVPSLAIMALSAMFVLLSCSQSEEFC